MSFPAPPSSVGIAFSDTRGGHGSLLTSSCVSQQLLLEDNMSVEQVGHMARWGFGAYHAVQHFQNLWSVFWGVFLLPNGAVCNSRKAC